MDNNDKMFLLIREFSSNDVANILVTIIARAISLDLLAIASVSRNKPRSVKRELIASSAGDMLVNNCQPARQTSTLFVALLRREILVGEKKNGEGKSDGNRFVGIYTHL